jgi:hypothetical protein
LADPAANFFDASDSIDFREHTALTVVIYERRRLGLINLKPVRNSRFAIVLALVKLPAAAVTDIVPFRRIENHMGQRSAASAGTSSRKAFDNEVLRHLNRDDPI